MQSNHMQHYSRFHSHLRAIRDFIALTRVDPFGYAIRSTDQSTCSSLPPDERLAPRGRSKCNKSATRERSRPFFHDEDLAKTEARMVVARRSGSGTSDLRKRGSPQNLANGWIRGKVVKMIVSLLFALSIAIVMERKVLCDNKQCKNEKRSCHERLNFAIANLFFREKKKYTNVMENL